MFVLLTEFCGVRHRGMAGGMVWVGFFVVAIALAGFAYAIRDWRHFTMVTGAPGILFGSGWL